MEPKHHQMQINIKNYPSILSNDEINDDDDNMENLERKEAKYQNALPTWFLAFQEEWRKLQ